jgi:superkiller protein 3
MEYASRTFEFLSKSVLRHSRSRDDFIPIFFALDRYCKRRPHDASALHFFGLVCERIGHIETAAQLVGRAIEILETIYEETEDTNIERQFVIANSSLGRIRVSLRDYENALQSFEAAQGLIPEASHDQSTDLLQTQCKLGCGLAYFHLMQYNEALACFQGALAASQADTDVKGHANVLLAQTLWALNTPEFQETAKNHLLQR